MSQCSNFNENKMDSSLFNQGMSNTALIINNSYGIAIMGLLTKMGISERICLNLPLTVEMLTDHMVKSKLSNAIAVSAAAVDFVTNSKNEPEKSFSDYHSEANMMIQKQVQSWIAKINRADHSDAPVVGNLFFLPNNKYCDGDLLQQYTLAKKFTVYKFCDVMDFFREQPPKLSWYACITIINELETVVNLSSIEF